MGTNYYAMFPGKDVCSHCGRGDNPTELHIGKSSAGWCFSLHVIPENGLNTLEDWKALLSDPGVRIRDEYSRTVTLKYLLNVITDRNWEGTDQTPEWHKQNHAESGPNGLARHEVGRFCAGHGKGTWDYCTGEFS